MYGSKIIFQFKLFHGNRHIEMGTPSLLISSPPKVDYNYNVNVGIIGLPARTDKEAKIIEGVNP